MRLLGRFDDAALEASGALAVTPHHRGACLEYVRALLAAGRIAEVCAFLDTAISQGVDDARLYALRGHALVLAGDFNGALASLQKAKVRNPGGKDHQLTSVVVLTALGQTDEAAALLGQDRFRIRRLAKFYDELLAVQLRRGETALAARLKKDARIILTPASVHAGSGSVDHVPREKTEAVFERISADAAADVKTLGSAYVLLRRAGLAQEAKCIGRRLNARTAESLPDNLAAALHDLRTSALPPSNKSPAVQWAWELADKTRWTYGAWSEAVGWGSAAYRLVRDVVANAPERTDELLALTNIPDTSAFQSLDPNRGCLVVSSHLGPAPAGVSYLRSFLNMRVYGGAGAEPSGENDEPIRIDAIGHPVAALRELIRELKSGRLVALAADCPRPGESTLEQPFLGRTVSLPTKPTRLIWANGLQSVMFQARWVDERITIEVERLPDAIEGEGFAEWQRRWIAIYLGKLATIMQGEPENLSGCSDGIWENVDTQLRSAIRSARRYGVAGP